MLIANERTDRLALLAEVAGGLGHDVIAPAVEVSAVSAVTARERPDVALVGLGQSPQHALELIEKIICEGSCPAIALLCAEDPDFIREAARRGVFAYIVDIAAEELQSAFDITLRRFSEYRNLQAAFGRRAAIEQAKGILMARHGIGADQAFEMLCAHAARNGRKVAGVAAALIDSHGLSLPSPATSSSAEAPGRSR